MKCTECKKQAAPVDLWVCERCARTFHPGCSGACDDYPEICDDCWVVADKDGGYEVLKRVTKKYLELIGQGCSA